MKRETMVSAANGFGRGDGYDATMRRVWRRDNAPGGAMYKVIYTEVGGSDVRVWYADTYEEAVWRVKYGPAADAYPVRRRR